MNGKHTIKRYYSQHFTPSRWLEYFLVPLRIFFLSDTLLFKRWHCALKRKKKNHSLTASGLIYFFKETPNKKKRRKKFPVALKQNEISSFFVFERHKSGINQN